MVAEQSRILPIIQEMATECGITVDSVSQLHGGRTNESYVVHSKDSKYLARIAGVGTESIIDRDAECHNTNVAYEIGTSPALHYARNGNLLMDYIEGLSTTDQEVLTSPITLDKVTTQLYRLHSSSRLFKGDFSFLRNVHVYRSDVLRANYCIPAEITRYEDELFQLIDWVDSKWVSDLCPCHGDAVLQNFILCENRAFIIDWEYSAMADRYLDLASFCVQNDLRDEIEQQFLCNYFSKGIDNCDWEKFYLYKMSISFMWVYWHLGNVAHGKQPGYNGPRWMLRLNNALENKRKWELLS